MRYVIRRIPQGYEALIPVPLGNGGELVVRAQATFREVQQQLQRKGIPLQRLHQQATTEGFFGDVGGFVKKLTKNTALRKAVNIVGDVVKHPVFSAAVAAIPGVGVPIAGGIQAAVAAEKLIRHATQAPKGSRKRIAARTTIKAAKLIAKREAEARRQGKVIVPKARTQAERTMRYLVQLAPAA